MNTMENNISPGEGYKHFRIGYRKSDITDGIADQMGNARLQVGVIVGVVVGVVIL